MDTISVTIKSTNGTTYNIVTAKSTTIEELKYEFSSQCDVPVDQIKLVYAGKVLKNDWTVEGYGMFNYLQ